MDDPKWLAKARAYVGMSEVPGPKHAPFITKWLGKLKAPFKDDETAWCGSFVGGVLEEVGLGYVKDPWGARNWLKFSDEKFGRGLDKEKTDKFVGMYVNDLTLGYGERGRQAVERLMTDAFEQGLIPRPVPVQFAG